jgi:hypothetical protein
VTVHPSYNRPRFQNDVALIRLRQSTETSLNMLAPVCLPLGNYERFSSDVQTANGIIAGYGMHLLKIIFESLLIITYFKAQRAEEITLKAH